MSKIAVDLDGTLAHYDHWRGNEHIGAPIQPMVDQVKEWIEQGHDVEIFTARVSVTSEAPDAAYHISKWLREVGLPDLEITAIKKKEFDAFYDDRAYHVIKNEGIIV